MRSNITITTSVINRERQIRTVGVVALPNTDLLDPRLFSPGLGRSHGIHARGAGHGYCAAKPNYAQKPGACWSEQHAMAASAMARRT